MRIFIILVAMVSCVNTNKVDGFEYQEASHCKITTDTSYCKIFQSGKEFCIYTKYPDSRYGTSVNIGCDIFDNMKRVKIEKI